MIMRALVQVVLILALFSPTIFFSIDAANSRSEVVVSREKHTNLRTIIGNTEKSVLQVKSETKNLEKAANRRWENGQAELRIHDAIEAARLNVIAIGAPEVSIDDFGSDESKIQVRCSGTLAQAKEAMWNLGDLGPTVRLDHLRAEYNKSIRLIVWTFSIRIEGLNSATLSGAGQSKL
ncbi:MAG: hypothetical protein AAB680_01520 [Pseudomonadota bacterium]